ncbi:double-strand break repair helicase AddA [Limibacillus halophilus]|uniref:DNA 3'-5' helicase n=1 Tax=Limibacillus halophilus TaxID=1579333 RepID=A0A839SQ97_9PROT|nr:double-strand break repair helicase AddA [Limibacillus halophilus]MBB3064014.1 ATP-dependent helicase/nuclease subunit A [Limibacillus halophilus]
MSQSLQGATKAAYDKTSANQKVGADPSLSVWVGASAGSGKTQVLSDRVLRLLLAGSSPTRLLCLTFTKAAAAEMEKRIAGRLSSWTAASLGDLELSLEKLLGRFPHPEETTRARSLFAQMLDAPGGLKIQTIHSFCQSILSRFPLEAGITPNFEALDERSAQELLARAREEVLEAVYRAAPASEPWAFDLHQALHYLAGGLGEEDFAKLLSGVTSHKDRLRLMVEGFGGLEHAVVEIYRRLDLTPDLTQEALVAEAGAEGNFNRAGLTRLAEAYGSGTPSEQTRGAALADWLAGGHLDPQSFAGYCALFLTKDGEPRKSLLTKALHEAHPELLEVAQTEAARLIAVRQRAAALGEAVQTAALLRLGWHMTEAYQRAKRAAVALDYDDMILLVRDLLDRPGVSSWVHYKLDGGIDHVLVDEAQDTSPPQWQVIEGLIEEFFTGMGASEDRSSGELPPRSLFVVGDPKQSIFGFQGAAPRLFSEKNRTYEQRAREAERPFASLTLDMSFRSTQPILDAVDAVFDRDGMEQGVSFDETWRPHKAYRAGQAGSVELWPPVEPEEETPLDPWAPPLVPQERRLPRTRLAELIAAKIHYWTRDPAGKSDPACRLAARDRRLRPGDFMVLVQRRNAFVSELVRALKSRDVPVAGVDRMRLMEQLPIMDLVAFGNFLLLPEDDLTLATVLKGPLVNFDEQQLAELCWARKGSLWRALAARKDDDPAFAVAFEFLSEQLGKVDHLDPYELYQGLLSANQGRRQILARLGPEANDPLDEFLALALEYSRQHAPSLQGLLHWLNADGREIKRDLEQSQGVVRIMTVHAAKGLQAPVVFLPDTFGSDKHDRSLLWLEGATKGGNEPPLCLLPGASKQRSALSAALLAEKETESLEERRRLLYVAMTRAEDRLIVCGYKGKQNNRREPWYDLVKAGLEAMDPPAVQQEFDFSEFLGENGWRGPGLVISSDQQGAPKTDAGTTVRSRPVALPDWALRKPQKESSPSRPLAPSRPSEIEPAVISPLGTDETSRFKRGLLVHRLLQTLPDLPEEQRRVRGLAFLQQPLHGLSTEDAEALLAETLAVIAAPAFAAVFGPGSRAEVPVTGCIEKSDGTHDVISARIDRLVVTDSEVLIIDYKSNRPAAKTEADVPGVYLHQMASYRALLLKIYPSKDVRCALLWTEGPRLMQLTQARLLEHAP